MDVGYRLHCTFIKSHPSLGTLNTPQTVGLWKLAVLEISVFEKHSSALINSLPNLLALALVLNRLNANTITCCF